MPSGFDERSDTLQTNEPIKSKSLKNDGPMELKTLVTIILLPVLSKVRIEDSFFESPAVEAVKIFYPFENKCGKKRIELASKMCLLKTNHLPKAEDIIEELESNELIGLFKESSRLMKERKRLLNDSKLKLLLLERENRYLTQRQKCMLCEVRPRQVVSLPCGHITQCKECSDRNPTCPSCNMEVAAEANIYMA